MNVKVNKSYLMRQYPDMIIADPIFDMALCRFLDRPTDMMPTEMFGKLVTDYDFRPEHLIAQTEDSEPTPEWSASIEVVRDRLKMTIRHNGEEMVYGKSYVQDTDDLGMMQAISYAAHMCYKMVQQRSM
jgi:hypothetical protein